MCLNCRRKFFDEDVLYIYHNEEPMEAVCPWCKSEEIEDIKDCAQCGETFFKTDLEDGDLCSRCASITKKSFDSMIKEAFTENQIAYLSSLYELF